MDEPGKEGLPEGPPWVDQPDDEAPLEPMEASAGQGGPTAQVDSPTLIAEREIDTGGRNLRQHAARGTLVNSAFNVGLAGVGLLQRVVIVAFLTRSEFGLWGIIASTLITLSWLKQLGIADKYIQQAEPDQEAAFQKAFTLELLVSLAFFGFVVLALPVYALAYGRPEMLLPGLVVATAVPISAFETPAWIPYRRMQFARQRVLTSVDPLVALVVTIVLGVLGAGVWCLVIGVVSGSIAGGLVATLSSPYPMRLRFDRSTFRGYVSFSWPLMGLGVSNLVVVQGTLLIANRTVGLAGLGAIGLAGSIASFADRVDGIIGQTLYPAMCAVADRVELLHEVFVKSNRVTLMWGMPFGVGLALFANDLVTYVFGEHWRPAVGLLAAIGLIAGFTQVAYNWSLFMRAVNDTKPIFQAALINVGIFFVVMVPALLTLGLAGYPVGLGVSVAVQIFVRGHFLGRLFSGFTVLPHLFRAVAPSVPAAGLVLLVRLLAGGEDSLAQALTEFALYIAATLAFTIPVRAPARERAGGLRPGPGRRPVGSDGHSFRPTERPGIARLTRNRRRLMPAGRRRPGF